MSDEKILIVEDENIIAIHIQGQLEYWGYQVIGIAASGEDAVRMSLNNHPDLILMDIKLEGKMDGIEAVEKIHSKLDVPVIYITAYADEATYERAKATEPSGYILKPFKPEQLKDAIERAFGRNELEKSDGC